jgi:glycosyltransferase involved in cell wall biosynthesis
VRTPRILLANYSSRRVAGTETYLEDLMTELSARKAPVALLAEGDEPAGRSPIFCPDEAAILRSLPEAEAWGPDVVMINGRLRGDWEIALTQRYPSVYFIHNYHGTCISGLKRFWRPNPTPCSRQFGPACLALYLPRSCGGSNPLTMIRLYGQERAHQERLRTYRMFITHSDQMKEEYVRHGFPEDRIHVIPFACVSEDSLDDVGTAVGDVARWSQGPLRLLFAGRMEQSKGGQELIQAAARLAVKLKKQVHLTMAGQGGQKASWEKLARRLETGTPNLSTEFPGWLDGTAMKAAYRSHHLFVMPSLWPEPFGKGGMEAACGGCPSVGFRMGGVPQWLKEGVSGHLAEWRSNPVEELSEALRRALQDPAHYVRLRRGARLQAENFTARAHADSLLPLLTKVAETRGGS